MSSGDLPVTVRAVDGPADEYRFLAFAHELYRDDPNWVPPLLAERREHLSRRKNPYFLHADAQLFLATRGDVLVGRISAQVDRLRLEHHRDSTGQFGFLDAYDDPEVFAALTEAVAQWLRARGMSQMQGPFSFSINDEMGLLVDGFDTPPRMMMGHAKSYFGPRLEDLHFAKVKDVFAYDYDGTIPLPRAMASMVERARASGDLEVRPISKRHLESELEIIVSIFNDAWSHNWGFVPMTKEEIEALGKNLQFLVGNDYIAIASWQGEPAAMAVTLPDLNLAIRDLNGRLLPFGWAKLLWRLFARAPAAVRMPLMGVRREHHGTPVGAALAIAVVDEVRRSHLKRGTKRAELSWILEDNVAMRRMIEALGGVPYKTYRIYERGL